MAGLFDLTDEHYVLSGIHTAHAALSRGDVVVVPTDTVYGLAACPKVEGAIERLVRTKGRGLDMAPPILVSGIDQAEALVAEGAFSDALVAALKLLWPGALTIVLPINPSLGFSVGDTPGTIALRAPNQPELLELLRIHGPLAVTSANLTGQPPCHSISEAINVFGDDVSVYLNAGSGSGTNHEPSTIIDATSFENNGVVRIIRQGAISVTALMDAGLEVAP
jgi:L-threonylcarbamoyladenylate synthase